VTWAEVYFNTNCRLHPSSRLATIDMNRKLGAVCLLGGAATPSNTTMPGPTFTSVSTSTLIHNAVDHNRHWPKIGWGWVCLFLWVAGSPSNTKSPGAETYLHTKWHLSRPLLTPPPPSSPSMQKQKSAPMTRSIETVHTSSKAHLTSAATCRPTKSPASRRRLRHFGLHLPLTRRIVKISRIL